MMMMMMMTMIITIMYMYVYNTIAWVLVMLVTNVMFCKRCQTSRIHNSSSSRSPLRHEKSRLHFTVFLKFDQKDFPKIHEEQNNVKEGRPTATKRPRHSCDLSPAPLVYFFPAGVLFSTENAKGTILNMPSHALPINKYAKQNQQVHQSKQQIYHFSIFIQ